MKPILPSMVKFEKAVFGKKNPFSTLLGFSIDLMGAKQAGLLYGTNQSYEIFIAPELWDRGVIHRFKGRGLTGLYLKLFGKAIIRFKGLSPVALYKQETPGKIIVNDGIIAYLLRNYLDFYESGVKIVIVREIAGGTRDGDFLNLPVLSYDGQGFSPLFDLKVNSAITTQFIVKNFIGAYVPDYGTIMVDTVDPDLLQWASGEFVHEIELKHRLDLLIQAIETASLACFRHLKGKKAVETLWRKEKALRTLAVEIKKKQADVDRQKSYLMAVGAVTEAMVNMEPVRVDDGVYAFVDMVGSTRLRNFYSARDYFFMTNQFREIAANLTACFTCRLGNFIGDAVFLQSASVFDPDDINYAPTIHERTVLMTLLLVAIFRELDLLVRGLHPIDPVKRVQTLLDQSKHRIELRCGIEVGPATIGPIGSMKRRMITAIGEAVDRAARLEASGLPSQIHMSSTVMRLLKQATISPSTKLVYSAISGYDYHSDSNYQPDSQINGLYAEEKNLLKKLNSSGFMDFYRSGFPPGQEIVTMRSNVHYKEFSSEKTYLLNWNKNSCQENTCLGI
ncbi:MAG: adenylate/guanylate cyclase domain-containing protein [Desulfobacterium sp.]|nr:adenylate/guanylate cyclase domain-containing protein [Desulfobacterium sp.]